MKIISVVGARPNFMKIAPFVHALESCRQIPGSGETVEHVLVHTGQHYDQRMSSAFFTELRIPRPDLDLEIGSGSHAEQVGNTMIAFEKVLRDQRPDWVVVVGDVNATCACSITAKKEHVRLAHIEAGLRSRDMSMPEEINRLVTDRLSDLLFATDEIAVRNLLNEGVEESKIKLVGNIMIDTLEANRQAAAQLDPAEIIAVNRIGPETQSSPDPDKKAGSGDPARNPGRTDARGGHPMTGTDGEFALITMHRPSNVDKPEIITPIIDFLLDVLCSDMKLLWPIHPRTARQLRDFGLWERIADHPGLVLLQPLGYHEMLRLNMAARLMLTDSGGLQEECCVLGTPCLTLRWNTERPITLREHGGASVLVGNDVANIDREYRKLRQQTRTPQHPPLWDGHTAERIVSELYAEAAGRSRSQ